MVNYDGTYHDLKGVSTDVKPINVEFLEREIRNALYI